MATSCVGKNRCSSHAPGWLSTPHPSKDDGIVSGTVCFHWDSGCCHWSTNIRVRNCSGFYVYELGPPPTCWLRYCGNGGGMLHLLQQTVKVWPVWQAETKGPFPSLPNPLSLFPPFPSPFLRLSRRLEKYNNQGSQIPQIWRILRQNCSDDSTEVTEGVTSTPKIFGNKHGFVLTFFATNTIYVNC